MEGAAIQITTERQNNSMYILYIIFPKYFHES